MTEDLDEFLDEDEFADIVTVEPANGAPSFTLRGIFDEPFVDAEASGANVETGAPTITCKETDAVAISRGDRCTVRARAFDVLQVRPDGTGMAVVQLAS